MTESCVMLLSNTFHSHRCRICWPGCGPCPSGSAGNDLMVIWCPQLHRHDCSLSPLSPFWVSLQVKLLTRFLSSSLSFVVWLNVTRIVMVMSSVWVNRCYSVQLSWRSLQAGKLFHVITAQSNHIWVSLSRGLAIASTFFVTFTVIMVRPCDIN